MKRQITLRPAASAVPLTGLLFCCVMVLLLISGCTMKLKNGQFAGFAPYNSFEAAERERKREAYERDEKWHRFRMQYDVDYRNEQTMGTANERSFMNP